MNTPSYYRDILNQIESKTLTESNSIEDRKTQIIAFVKYALAELNCEQKPKITLSTSTAKVQRFKSFGNLEITTGHIWVYIANRNLADILRTICHEIIHYKQLLDGKITGSSDGVDGSEIENEANSKAAVIMRKYGRENPKIFE